MLAAGKLRDKGADEQAKREAQNRIDLAVAERTRLARAVATLSPNDEPARGL